MADEKEQSFDVIIVGAGISGINAAYRVQTELPESSYAILENRAAIGGTWDLFRYPGIRSDSDLHTFGFRWRPWPESQTIADGPSIRKYLKETAEMFGIDKHINFHHKLIHADWSSKKQMWSLQVEADGKTKYFNARFVILGTGYYDYETPLEAEIPGIGKFQGKTIHPQFWPEDYDYSGKKMAIIGSGATAVTIFPIVAKDVAHVTMVQRSPGYVISLPKEDRLGNLARKILPQWMAFKVVRWKFLVLPFLFYKFCLRWPNAARRILRKQAQKQLPSSIEVDPHFKPSYNPWEQRLCVCPDGDFYKCLHNGNASIVTGHIKAVDETGITMEDGTRVDADVIVTATGLKLRVAGGASISVDGQAVKPSEKFFWKSTMFQDIPNLATIIGYTNASWTLGSDAAALLITRLLKHLRDNNYAAAIPHIEDPSKVNDMAVLNLNSTYIERGKHMLPKSGDVAPWLPRSTYFADLWDAVRGDLKKGLRFTRQTTAS